MKASYFSQNSTHLTSPLLMASKRLIGMAYSYSKILLSMHMNIVLWILWHTEKKGANKTMQTARFPNEQCRPSAIFKKKEKDKSIDSNKGEFISIPYSVRFFTWPVCIAFAKSSHASPLDGKCWWKNMGLLRANPRSCKKGRRLCTWQNINFFEKWN